MALYTAQILSFGYQHGAPPADAALVLDLRNALYDPRLDPAGPQPTARDGRALQQLADNPRARDIVRNVAELVASLGTTSPRPTVKTNGHYEIRVHVALGCADGRLRAPGLAILTAQALAAAGWNTELNHRDLDRPAS